MWSNWNFHVPQWGREMSIVRSLWKTYSVHMCSRAAHMHTPWPRHSTPVHTPENALEHMHANVHNSFIHNNPIGKPQVPK